MKKEIKQKHRFVEGFLIYKETESTCSYIRQFAGRWQVKFFRGRAEKCSWYYGFKMYGDAVEYLEGMHKGVEEILEKKEAEKRERKESLRRQIEEVEVGEIYYSSWGYDQTNVDFYQVTGKTKAGFKIKAIHSSRVSADKVIALADTFVEGAKEMTKRTFSVSSFEHIRKWDGEPAYVTPFGYGH